MLTQTQKIEQGITRDVSLDFPWPDIEIPDSVKYVAVGAVALLLGVVIGKVLG